VGWIKPTLKKEPIVYVTQVWCHIQICVTKYVPLLPNYHSSMKGRKKEVYKLSGLVFGRQ